MSIQCETTPVLAVPFRGLWPSDARPVHDLLIFGTCEPLATIGRVVLAARELPDGVASLVRSFLDAAHVAPAAFIAGAAVAAFGDGAVLCCWKDAVCLFDQSDESSRAAFASYLEGCGAADVVVERIALSLVPRRTHAAVA